MLFETNKDKGRAGMSFAIAYFGSNGYTVSVPLNDTQWYDLIIEKDGIFQTVQCKATGSQNNTISLRNCGGTKGKEYDNILNHNLDLLFCLNSKQELFVIPIQDLKQYTPRSQITLNTNKPLNNQGFPSYKYQVQL